MIDYIELIRLFEIAPLGSFWMTFCCRECMSDKVKVLNSFFVILGVLVIKDSFSTTVSMNQVDQQLAIGVRK